MNPKEAQIAALTAQLEKGLEESKAAAEERLSQADKMVSTVYRDLIATYSNDVKNIGQISGIIAPFSLMLLDIDELSVTSTYLVVGFICLLLNVLLTQMFVRLMAIEQDKNAGEVTKHLLFATLYADRMNDRSVEVTKRVSETMEYQKYIQKTERLLSAEILKNPQLTSLRKKLKRYTTLSFYIFALGITFIILSIVLAPLP